MEPIISPWFIYLLGIIDATKAVFWTFGILGMIALMVLLVIHIVEKAMDEMSDEGKKGILTGLRASLVMSLLLLPAIFVPSKNTIIAMYVADNITPNNVEKALEVGQDFKNEIKKDIIDLIDGINKAKDGEE